METEILNKILVQVEKIGTDLTEFKQEMYDFRKEVNERFDKNEKELTEFKEEMYNFRDEVYELFDKNTKEIADEIHELGRMINRKTKQEIKEAKEEIRQEDIEEAIA